MSFPKLHATYQPNLTMSDFDVPLGFPIAFDAGKALLSLGAEDVFEIASQVGRPSPVHLDALAEAAGLMPAGKGHHDGCSHVKVDPVSVRRFLYDLWLDDVETLTDDDLRVTRDTYAEMTAEAA